MSQILASPSLVSFPTTTTIALLSPLESSGLLLKILLVRFSSGHNHQRTRASRSTWSVSRRRLFCGRRCCGISRAVVTPCSAVIRVAARFTFLCSPASARLVRRASRANNPFGYSLVRPQESHGLHGGIFGTLLLGQGPPKHNGVASGYRLGPIVSARKVFPHSHIMEDNTTGSPTHQTSISLLPAAAGLMLIELFTLPSPHRCIVAACTYLRAYPGVRGHAS